MSIKDRLEGLRSGAYFDVWADLWRDECQHIKDEVMAQMATGDFKAKHLVLICDKYELPWKTFVEQLEKDGVLPTGIYDRFPPIGKLRKVVYGVQEDSR